MAANGLLLGAHDAMREGHTGRALALLDTHAEAFPAEPNADRQALRLLLRCLEEDGNASADAAAFLASSRVGRFRKSLRRACGMTRLDPRLHRAGS